MCVWKRCILVAILCACTDIAFATSIPVTGSILYAPLGEIDVNLSGPAFSISTQYFIPFSRIVNAPSAGTVGTLSFNAGMSDYESPVDGSPSDSASLGGVAGIVEGFINFQVTYDPSLPSDPTTYATSVGGIPVSFSGGATAYTCSPAPSGGCFAGIELWTADLSGTGTATVELSPSGQIYDVQVGQIAGDAVPGEPPTQAREPSELPFLGLVLTALFLLRRRRTA